MESLLCDIPGVLVYLDDILITGPTDADHLKSLQEALSRLEKVGLRLQKQKCSFMASSVLYLGYQIDKEGLHPLESKLEAIKQAPQPRNVTTKILSWVAHILRKILTSLTNSVSSII